MFELAIVGVLGGQQNHFVQLASLRMVEILCLTEITFGFVTLFLVSSSAIITVSSLTESLSGISLVFVILLGCFWLIASDKVPFDLVEAESELIDGITVDLAGAYFSMIYAGECAFVFVSAKLFVITEIGFLWASFATVAVLIFAGRIFVARFLLSDLENLLFSVGLAFSASVFVIVGAIVGICLPKFN